MPPLWKSATRFTSQFLTKKVKFVVLQKRDISFRSLNLSKKSSEDKPWRDSSSLIIIAPMNNSQPFSLGYLMMERSKKSTLPGGTVFPGGVLSPSDYSPRWIEMFKEIDVDIKSAQFMNETAHIPEIYLEDTNNLPFPKSVVLRLTAIRETFEEVGILLCRRNSIDQGHTYEYDELFDRKVVQNWQTKIRKNSEEFINLCTDLKCVPDLSALHEWSNWLTPTIAKPKARFNTIFFMTLLPKMLRVSYDSHEVASAQWASSSSLLQEHLTGKVKLMPPQLYELSRLASAKTFADFESKMKIRKEKGIERFFPVMQQAQDGSVFILPGDDMYPENIDAITPSKFTKLNETIEQLRSNVKHFHRAEVTKQGVYNPVINISRYGHVY